MVVNTEKTPPKDFRNLGYVQVCAATPALTIGDAAANAKAILAQADALADQGFHSGLSRTVPDRLLGRRSVFSGRYSNRRRADQLQRSRVPLMAVGAPWRLADGRMVCAVMIGDGRVLGMVPSPSAKLQRIL